MRSLGGNESSTVSQALEIVTLQHIDDEIASARAAIALAEERIAQDEEVDRARATLEVAEGGLRDAQRDQKRLEAEVARLNGRIVPEEKRLYSGEVKSPRELSSIEQEVGQLKERRAAFETDLLTVLERVEQAEEGVRSARANLDRQETRWAADRRELTASAAALRVRVETETARRAEQAGRIVPASLQVYELVRKRKGIAVARVQGQACAACRIALPEAVRKRAMSPVMLAQCPSCDRILYVG